MSGFDGIETARFPQNHMTGVLSIFLFSHFRWMRTLWQPFPQTSLPADDYIRTLLVRASTLHRKRNIIYSSRSKLGVIFICEKSNMMLLAIL